MMSYQAYEPETLKKLQAVEVEMLKDFASLCEEHGIDYFGIGGTLLGAVRHQGFIPWDDDIDIGMTVEHYEHFLQVADGAFDGKYKLINFDINNNFPNMFTKWYKTGTVFRDNDAMAMGYSTGIFIDIFRFDNAPDDGKQLRSQAMKAWILSKLFILSLLSNPIIMAYGIKAKVMKLASKIIYRLLKIIRISPRTLYDKANQASLAYEAQETQRVTYIFDMKPYLNLIKRSDIYPTQFMTFEDIKIRFPHNPEAYLNVCYGSDYMTLPPEDKRHNHPPTELDFGEEE